MRYQNIPTIPGEFGQKYTYLKGFQLVAVILREHRTRILREVYVAYLRRRKKSR